MSCVSQGNTFDSGCHYVERRRVRHDLSAADGDHPQTGHERTCRRTVQVSVVQVYRYYAASHSIRCGLFRAGFKCVEVLGRIIKCAFSALTLLFGRQEGHPACKKQSGRVLVWLSVWSKVQTTL